MYDDPDRMWRGVPKRAIGGLVAVLLPFLLSCTETITRTGGFCTHYDYFAILGGGIGAAIGLSMLAVQAIPLLHRAGYLVLIAGIGGVQIARGLGYIGGPCN